MRSGNCWTSSSRQDYLKTATSFIHRITAKCMSAEYLATLHPYLYEPLIHIPLMISAPGQNVRHDIYTHTSSTDVLPTLVNLAGREMPAGSVGRILPDLGGTEDTERSIFSGGSKDQLRICAAYQDNDCHDKGRLEIDLLQGLSGTR